MTRSNKHRLGWLIATVISLSGCATMSVDECAVADWREIGLQDGSNGYQSTQRLAAHRKACAKAALEPDIVAYREGHATGLLRYCVPATAFQAATVPTHCPTETREEMEAAASAARDINELYDRLEALRADSDEMLESLADPEMAEKTREATQHAIREAEREMAYLELEIEQMEIDARHLGWR